MRIITTQLPHFINVWAVWFSNFKRHMKKKTQKKPSIGVEPLGDRVLIKESHKESGGETKSGIIIPETVSEDKGAKRGTVVAVGEGKFEDGKRVPISVSVGDSVLFQWGDLIKIHGEEYYIVSDSNVIAIIQ